MRLILVVIARRQSALTLESLSRDAEDVASKKSIALANQPTRPSNSSVSLFSLINCDITFPNEFKSAEVYVLPAGRIVGS
jgi:hypothetical protein